MTPHVKTLVREAVDLYKKSCSKRFACGSWNWRLGEMFENKGWVVSHPGSDKKIAIKGNVIAKWIGSCGWSDNAIRDELEFHSVLKKKGFARYLPKIYARRKNVFIVEQRVNGEIGEDDCNETYRELLGEGIQIADFCTRNVKAFMGVPKIVDGRLGDYDGEDGCSDDCYDDEDCCSVDEGADENF